MKSIQVRDLSFKYTNEYIFKGIDLNIDEGEFIALIGGNGSGKSTFIKCLLGELIPETGEIQLEGTPVDAIEDFKHIGYVPQINIMNQISFPVTTTELVALNLYREFGFFKFSKKQHLARAKDMLIHLGLKDYIDLPVSELSGGLKQRTMIARAMINRPNILILDEPTAGIDEKNRKSFIEMINELKVNHNMTVLFITHDLEEILSFGKVDHVYELRDKKINRFDHETFLSERLDLRREVWAC